MTKLLSCSGVRSYPSKHTGGGVGRAVMKITQQQETNKHRRLRTQVPRHMPACAASSQKVMEDIFMSRSDRSLDQIIAEGFGCYLRAHALASHLYKS